MKKIRTITCLTLLAISSHALAHTNGYISVGGGVSIPSSKIGHYIYEGDNGSYKYQNLKNSGAFSIAIGKSFGNCRPELEYVYLQERSYTQIYKIYKTDYFYNFSLDSKAYLFNLNYDITQFNQDFQPYIVGSIGLAQNTASKSYLSSDKNRDVMYYEGNTKDNLALGLGTGIRMNVNSWLSFDGSYRYLDLGKIKGSNTIGDKKRTQETQNNNLDGKLKTNIFLAKIIVKF